MQLLYMYSGICTLYILIPYMYTIHLNTKHVLFKHCAFGTMIVTEICLWYYH